MPTRRMGTLAALVATALMLYSVPGLLHSLADASHIRMDERLQPPQTQLVTVWLLSPQAGDQKLIRQCCTAFEKENAGVRIFLRSARIDELTAPDAVLPDVLLFETGALSGAQDVLLPLTVPDALDTSGVSGGVRLALPLWSVPYVLRIPTEWMLPDGGIPWEKLTEPGALRMPAGAALLQCLMSAPDGLRGALLSGAPALERYALMEPLSQAQSADSSYTVAALTPVISDRTRYAALCRDSAPARSLLQFFAGQTARAGEHHLIAPADALLPNAFAHTPEELNALCADALRRGEDPALTLTRLQ